MSNQSIQVCTKCVMDSSDPCITFDQDGVSDSWHEGRRKFEKEVIGGDAGMQKAQEIAATIREAGRAKEYDCLIGLSGGIDSSFIALWVKRLGLRPLAVHMDNGWNSEIAVSNIESIIKKLDIDLYTEVLDWSEFRDLQRSFFFSSVPNCEIPTDHAIVSTLFRLAKKYDIGYVISGSNVATEGIYQKNAGYDFKDATHIRGIQRKFGSQKLRKYPLISLRDLAFAVFVQRIKFVPLLNYVNYDWKASIETLKNELGWRSYPRKHGESLFTRFFQEYYLPTKYNIDKRKMHYSSLICAAQMERREALELLSRKLYTDQELNEEIEFVCDKLQFTNSEFKSIMDAAPRKHKDYATSLLFRDRNAGIYQWARRLATGRSSE